MTAKVSAQIVAPLFGALMAYGVFDMNAQNIAHDQQGATQPQGGDRPTHRGGPKQKDKILTGRTVVGGPPIVTSPADCTPTSGEAPAPAPAAMVQSSSGGARPKGAGGHGRTAHANPSSSDAPRQRHRGGPRGGGRDKEDVGRAAPGGPVVIAPQAACPPTAAVPPQR